MKESETQKVRFNLDCERWGTEYGGFYIPHDFVNEKSFLVYSFGIGEDLSFSEAVINQGGVCYAFDPTPKAIKFVEHHQLFSDPNFHFLPYGISDTDGEEDFYLPKRPDYVSASIIPHKSVDHENAIKVKMKTLRTIMQELGHEKIDILKMDIEGAEFQVMDNIMDPDLEPIDIKLVCLETHERFFEKNECLNHLFETMKRNGFNHLYGTEREPTFVKGSIKDRAGKSLNEASE